jgi:hypothetical protein
VPQVHSECRRRQLLVTNLRPVANRSVKGDSDISRSESSTLAIVSSSKNVIEPCTSVCIREMTRRLREIKGKSCKYKGNNFDDINGNSNEIVGRDSR